MESVGRFTLDGGNKRGDWMKHWMMLQGYTALNTMYRRTPQKQTTFISPKGKEKQIDYILTKRRYLRHAKDAEANDSIHMGSDHRCVMATFTINMLEKNIHIKNTRKHDTIEHDEREQAEQIIEAVNLSSKKYKEIIENIIKKTATTNNAAAQAESEARKAQAKEGNAAAAGAICENAEAKAEEMERICKGNMKSDSVVTANENDGWHRGRASLSAAHEDEEHIEFNNDHVKHDMNEDPKKVRTQQMRQMKNILIERE